MCKYEHTHIMTHSTSCVSMNTHNDIHTLLCNVCTHRQERKVKELEEEIKRERQAAEPLVASMVRVYYNNLRVMSLMGIGPSLVGNGKAFILHSITINHLSQLLRNRMLYAHFNIFINKSPQERGT